MGRPQRYNLMLAENDPAKEGKWFFRKSYEELVSGKKGEDP